MKIAFILPSLSKNGPIIYTKYLIESLKDYVDIIDIYYFNNVIEIDFDNINCKKISFFEKIDFNKYDIIHTHTAKADLYAYINKKNIGKKWISTVHNLYKKDLELLYNPVKAFILSQIWKLALTSMNTIVVFSDSMKKYYNQEIGSKNFFIIPTGVPKINPKSIDKVDQIMIEELKKKIILFLEGLVI
jgi:L-malate glycosyltransferase